MEPFFDVSPHPYHYQHQPPYHHLTLVMVAGTGDVDDGNSDDDADNYDDDDNYNDDVNYDDDDNYDDDMMMMMMMGRVVHPVMCLRSRHSPEWTLSYSLMMNISMMMMLMMMIIMMMMM